MSTPIKDNEHIRADDKAFKDAVRRARAQLGRIKGVVGVGFGLKEKAGEFSQDVAILVYVSAKQAADALSPENRIPPTFEGYRTDVRVALPTRPTSLICNDDTAYDTITGGIQIEAKSKLTPPEQAGLGTLGCIVQKRGDRGEDNVYLLTCQHVLLHEHLKTGHGDGVYHPWFPRTTPVVKKGTLLGKIDEALVRKSHVDDHGKPVQNEPSVDPAPLETEIDPNFDGTFVDCGAVRVELGSFCCGSACTRNDIQYLPTIPFTNLPPHPSGLDPANIDRIVDVRDLRNEPVADVLNTRVIKNGKSTGRTVGRITGIGPGHSIVRYPPGEPGHVTSFHYNVVEIVLDGPATATNPCTGTNDFGVEGDSGSLIVDEQNRAVALLYGGSVIANSAGISLTHACFIVPVLDTLGMCIPTTTGTSHGSSKATDGSGLALYDADLEIPQDETKVLFSRQAIAGATTRKAPPALAAPATEEQRALMLPLLDALRETERGRELHEALSQLSREIAYLVRRCRPVTVAWHRNRGPAFLACVLNHLKGEASTIPHEIAGVSRATLLARMGRVLYEHGSNPLRDAIERHRDVLMSFANGDTAQECIEMLRRSEYPEVSA